MTRRFAGVQIALLTFAAVATSPAEAQRSSATAAPSFVFATVKEARTVLGASDEYVRATTPLERSAKLKVTDAVDEERFVRHMRNAAMEWTEGERRKVESVIEVLTPFLEGIKWKIPERLLLVQADPVLEDAAPHTRDNAIVIPASALARGPAYMAHLLAHETFHVLTRKNPELREALYSAIGFRRCEKVVIPPAISALRITNPDTVESRHTISVRYQGEPAHALPYVRFPSADIDPRAGFMKQLQVAWLLVERSGDECVARGGPQEGGVVPQELDGLFERVGRNTQYLFHAEEIRADNFTLLFLTSIGGSSRSVPSPEILERLRKILFE